MDYVPKYFQPYELVPKETYRILERQGKLNQVWWLFDPRILLVGDRLRKRYGKMECNTWWWKGQHSFRGWRPPECTIGAARSQHRFGRALDLIPLEATVEEIHSEIISNGEDFGFITCVEIGVSWLHVDCRNYQGLLIVHP